MSSPTYQYVSEAAYAAKRTPSRGGARNIRWSSLDVLGEALRWRSGHYLSHFANRGITPAEPIFVDGMADPDDILAWHERLASVALAPDSSRPQMMTARGLERQRENSPVLLSVVAGYPESGLLSEVDLMQLDLSARERYMRELIATRREETLQSSEFMAWRDKTLQWAKDRYGANRLRLAVVHYDESHIHMHILFDDEGRTVKPMSLHASEPLRGESSPAQRVAAYKEAGRKMQDSYHAAVAQPLGIGRVSPAPRGRMSSAERKAARARERAQLEADGIVRQAQEESRLLMAAAHMEAEAVRRTAVERARRDAEAAYAQVETDLARLREQKTFEMDREIEQIRTAERTRVVAEIRDQMSDALAIFRNREANWLQLLKEFLPDEGERTRAMAAAGLVKLQPATPKSKSA